jgi:hypothetical protein
MAWLTNFMMFDEETAAGMLDDSLQAQSKAETMTMPPAGARGHPATEGPEPPDPIELAKAKGQAGPDDDEDEGDDDDFGDEGDDE